MKRLAIAAALAASFAIGGNVAAIGVPSEASIVAGIEACAVTARAATLGIPATRIPATTAACLSFTRWTLPLARLGR